MGNLSVGRCLKHVVEAPREGLRFRLFLVLVSLPCLARAGHLAPLLLLPIVFCLLDLFLFRCFAVFLVVAQCVCGSTTLSAGLLFFMYTVLSVRHCTWLRFIVLPDLPQGTAHPASSSSAHLAA